MLDDEILKRQISQYAISEDMGVSLLSQMLAFVPGDEERKFLESQIEDEKSITGSFRSVRMNWALLKNFFRIACKGSMNSVKNA